MQMTTTETMIQIQVLSLPAIARPQEFLRLFLTHWILTLLA